MLQFLCRGRFCQHLCHAKCIVFVFIYVHLYLHIRILSITMEHGPFQEVFPLKRDGAQCQPCCFKHFRFPWLGGPRHLCAKLGIYTSPAFISSSVAVCPLFSWYRADFSDTFVGHGGFDVATFWPEMGGGWDAVLGYPIVKVGALV